MVGKCDSKVWVFAALYIVLSIMSQELIAVPSMVSANPDVPIPNAIVVATGEGGYGFNVTNPSGGYLLTQGLTAGSYNVTAMAEGYISKELANISVVVGSETGNMNFKLLRSGGVSGKVTASGSGKPIADVIITASSNSSFGWFTMTDAEGNYRIITNLPSGTYNVSATYPIGYFGKTVSGISITTGVETKGVNLALDPSGIISGKVTTKTGDQSLNGVVVTAMSTDKKGYVEFATTEPDGTYRIKSGLGSGVYMVTVSQGSIFNQVQNVAVTVGKETPNVNLTLDVTPPPPSGMMKGKVTDMSNNPVEGATVSAGSGHGVTDEAGLYEITSGLPTGTYTVNVEANGYEPANKTGVAVTAGSVTLNINFQLQKIPATKSGRISGTVMGEDNPLASKQASTITCVVSSANIKIGESLTVSGTVSPAVGGASVTLLYKMGSTEVTRQATTGSDAKYSDKYSPSAAGSWTVTASWMGNAQYGGASSQQAAFTVTQAPSTGGLKVTAVDSGSKPLASASVSSTATPSGQSALSGVTGSDGSITFASVAPGSYTMQVSMTGYITNTGTASVAAGGTASVSITLQTKPASDGTTGGGGIPGYPAEALVLGIIISTAFIVLLRRRTYSTPSIL